MKITGVDIVQQVNPNLQFYMTMGGYMTATSTYDVVKHHSMGITSKYFDSETRSILRYYSYKQFWIYTLACHFTVESSSGTLKITSN